MSIGYATGHVGVRFINSQGSPLVLRCRCYRELSNILRMLVENKEAKFSIRKLSLLRKINYKSAYQAVMKLKKQGIISLEDLGNTINCSFKKTLNPLVFQIEHERRSELLKDKTFKILYERLNGMRFPFIALVFGSYANKKNIILFGIEEYYRLVQNA